MPWSAPDALRARRPSEPATAGRAWAARTGRAIARSARDRRWVATRAAIAMAIPLVIGVAVGHTTQGVQAGLGSFVALYAANEPYPRRAGLLAMAVVAATLAMVLGTLVGGHHVAAVVVGGVFATVCALGALAVRLGPPREYFVLLIFLLGTAMPTDPGAWASRGATLLAGAGLAALIALSPWLLHRHDPGPGADGGSVATPTPPPADARRGRLPVRWPPVLEAEHPRIALRVGLAMSVGLAIGYGFDLTHPSWVALTACSVLVATTASAVRSRGVQRAIGTAVGVVFAGLLYSLGPSEGVTIALIVVLLLVAQLVLVGSYGLGVVVLTGMVLLIFSMLDAGTSRGILDARVLDTFVGCAIAFVLVVLIPPRESGTD